MRAENDRVGISFSGKKCAVIVAHPDDETLWCGGVILANPGNEWHIISCCRGSDSERRERFFNAIALYHADGRIGDLDDGPDQRPLECSVVEECISNLLIRYEYDVIITHSVYGEYTRHRRHEEVAVAVLSLLRSSVLKTKKLCMFAYSDYGKKLHYPQPLPDADIVYFLTESVWQEKRDIIATTYGFPENGWEVRSASRTESFWSFESAEIEMVREYIVQRSNAP